MSKVITNEKWITYEQSRKVFGLSRWTLWRLWREGEIRGAKVGQLVRLDADSIEEYLERRADEFARK